MSFGLDIMTLDVDGNEHWISVVDGQTYNLSPMWQKALGIESTRDLDGKRCRDLLRTLDAGLLDATKNAHEYRDLEPDNGWGDYPGFYRTLAKFVELANKYPSGIVRWNG